jgi:hypothetical protein
MTQSRWVSPKRCPASRVDLVHRDRTEGELGPRLRLVRASRVPQSTVMGEGRGGSGTRNRMHSCVKSRHIPS